MIELQGTVGASVANERKAGFAEIVAQHSNIEIVRSQSGDFTRSRAKEVMENLIRAEAGQAICAVYAHNDDMMIGAILAAERSRSSSWHGQVLTISIDAVPDIFKAMF